MTDPRHSEPEEKPRPTPRDPQDQQAGAGDDPWDVPDSDRAPDDDVPDTDEAGTGRRGTAHGSGTHPDQPVPDEPSA
ncbi:hypothetical protein ACWD25_36355 [Streptomyces sp. NPDC002920]